MELGGHQPVTSLYRLFDKEGHLLYVGIGHSALVRLGAHLREKPWSADVAHAEIEHYDSRSAAEDAEREAIRAEKPLHNVVHNGRLKPEDPRWGSRPDDMPDMCHDHCVKQGDWTIYYPHEWLKGAARYRCSRGHEWTCWWGHNRSGRAAA